MPQEVLRQSNWNAGEIDPKMLGRRDLKAYYQAAEKIENCLTMPQGPMVLRPGSEFIDYVRHELEAIDLAGATMGAPHGGTAANAKAIDGTSLTTADDIGATNPYVVLTVDLGAAQTISAIDTIDFGLVDGGVAPSAPPVDYGYTGGGEGYYGSFEVSIRGPFA